MEDDEILEEEQEEVKEENESKANSTPGFKDIVITECKRVINQYKELMANSDDWKLLEGFNNPNKNDDECVNHIMNNLTKKRIYGGADSLMYEYIHEYYVDDLKEEQLKDNWSNLMRNTTPNTPGPKAQAKEDAKNKITEEQKQKFYEEALEEAKREAKFKAEEDFKKAEAKRKEQERIRKEKELEKKKAEEEKKAKALEEAKQSGAAEQMSIFDF